MRKLNNRNQVLETLIFPVLSKNIVNRDPTNLTWQLECITVNNDIIMNIRQKDIIIISNKQGIRKDQRITYSK